MKVFFEDQTNKYENENSNEISGLAGLGDGDDEIRIAKKPNGKYAIMKNGKLEEVPDSVQKELEAEEERQNRYKKAVKQGQKPEDIEAKSNSRFTVRHNKIDDDNRFKENPDDLPYYKQGASKEIADLFDRGYFEGTDVKKLTELLQTLLFTLVNNQVVFSDEEKEYVRDEMSYLRPNMRAVLDDDSTARGRRRVHYEPDEDEDEYEEQETFKPLAVVYRDVSGSFGTVAKDKLGNDIMNLLKSDYFTDAKGNRILDVDDYYFASSVSKDVRQTGGGTNLCAVLTHAAQLTKGRKANIIIITDSDAEGVIYRKPEPIVVNGSVWLIYCDTYSPNFGKYFRLAGEDGVFEEFFFSNI